MNRPSGAMRSSGITGSPRAGSNTSNPAVEPGRQQCQAFAATLAIADADDVLLRIDVGDLEPTRFADTQPRRVAGHEQIAILRRREGVEQILHVLR